jgi:oxygen-independent coproporphyrinogen-3 oxidase
MTLSLPPIKSLYIHFPVCAHLCNYCDFHKKLKETDFAAQISGVENLLRLQFGAGKKLISENGLEMKRLDTLYLGGGTPSLWGVRGAEYIKSLMLENELCFEDEYEFTMEVNPGSLNQELMNAWRRIGLNRISLGIQTLDPERLPLLDRYHSLNDSVDALELLQNSGMNYSVDLMIGLPEDTFSNIRKLEQEIRRLADYGPSHFSVYILTVKDNYKNYSKLPLEDKVVEEYQLVVELLHSLGYEQYEVSNFAKPGKYSRHNWKYWMGESVAAIGPSATGYLLSQPEHKAIRYKWSVKDQQLDLEVLSQKDLQLESIYLNLRVGNLEQALKGLTLIQQESLLNQWQKLGYLNFLKSYDLTHKHTLNWRGFLMIDSMAQNIYSYKRL